jgi:hypothetical protein
MGLDDPVKHRRLIELDKKARRVVVEDTLEMEEDHEVELYFHCSERCEVERGKNSLLLIQKKLAVEVVQPVADRCSVDLYTGSVSPLAGWVSRALDVREPAPTIVWRARLTGRAILRTELAVLRAA